MHVVLFLTFVKVKKKIHIMYFNKKFYNMLLGDVLNNNYQLKNS